jgi:protein-S-isoprenylcysteine O-methyltransferase Ste14
VGATKAAVGTAVFFALAPAVVAGVIPWSLTGWTAPYPLTQRWPLHIAGAALGAASTTVLVLTFARFVLEGAGAPAPVAPTEHMVVGGLYRYVRNPMYLAVTVTFLG